MAENVGYPLDRLGIKGKGKKELWHEKDFTEDTKATGKEMEEKWLSKTLQR